MNELVPALVVIIVGASAALVQASTFKRSERQLLLASFAAHVSSAFIQVWFTRGVYGYGDVLGYTAMGEILAAVMRTDPRQFVPEIFKMLLHLPAVIPVDIPGMGSSTASMAAVAGLFTYITGGSVYTLCAVIAMGAHFGQVAIYKAFKSSLPSTYHRPLLFAALLIPSAVFWSSGLIKEGVATLGLGYTFLGLEALLGGEFRIGRLFSLAFGVIVLGLFKAYILVAMAIATSAWIYFTWTSRSGVAAKPAYLIAGAIVAVAGNAIIRWLFPGYALDNLAEQAAYYQEMGQVVSGGSTYSIGDPTRTTLVGQLAYAPLALVTSLFRPFIFEARSPQVFINALETTVVLGLAVQVMFRRPLKDTWRLITTLPMLVFCAVFVVVFGVGVGLTTTNMGTLSRYRMPLVPFLWGLILVLRAAKNDQAGQLRTAPLLPIRGRLPTAMLRPEQRHVVRDSRSE